MTVPITLLAEALKTKLAAVTGKTFTRRYVPFLRAGDCLLGVWFVVASADDPTIHRHTDESKLTVDVAYQRGLPDSSDSYPDPLTNMPFLDGCLEEAESVKSLFRENGALRRHSLANCVFQNWSNAPLYRPDLLLEYQIFTSVIRLEYYNEGPDE